MNARQACAVLIVSVTVGVLVACAQEDEPLSAWLAAHAGPDAGSSAPDSGPPGEQPACRQAHAESLPQRIVTTAASDGGAPDLIYVSDLFDRFVAICGACHGPAADPPGLGNFRIGSESDFTALMNPSVLAHVTSDGPTDPSMPQDPSDPKDPMPPFASPSGEPFSSQIG